MGEGISGFGGIRRDVLGYIKKVTRWRSSRWGGLEMRKEEKRATWSGFIFHKL